MSAVPSSDPLAALRELEGAIPLHEYWKRYGLPKSTVYQAANDGELKTVTTAGGFRLVPPAEALRYLTANGPRPQRGRPLPRKGEVAQ